MTAETGEMTQAEGALIEMSPNIDLIVKRAQELATINDNESFIRADGFLVDIKEARKILDTKRKEFTQPLDLAKKRIMDSYKPKDTALAEAEMIIKGGTRKWFIAEQARKAEEERKQREEAARAEAERKRKEQEAIDKAAAQEAAGKPKEAEQTIKEAVKPVYTPTPEKVKTSFDSGRSYGTKTWKCEVHSAVHFFRAVAEDPYLSQYVEIKISKLNQKAREKKGMVDWPGIKVTEDVVMGVR
jgi:hypothetical protein